MNIVLFTTYEVYTPHITNPFFSNVSLNFSNH